MWKVLIFLVMILMIAYYITFAAHLFGLVKLTNELNFRVKWLIPFNLWINIKY